MNSRLQQFLTVENISQSQLADTLGVARASISHILAGRNKPGFDFIESMARHYPTINLEWLITGKGRMYRDSSPISQNINDIPSQKVEGTISEEQSEATLFPYSDEDDIPINSLDKIPKTIVNERHIAKIIVFYDDGTFQELK